MSEVRIAHLVELGRYGEALRMTESVLATEPDNVEALGYRTRCLYEQGDLQQALESGNRMVAAAPEDAWAHRLCSLVLDRLRQHEEALRAAQEAVRLEPWDWLNHAQVASAAMDVRGRLGDARDAASRALELAPHEPDAHFVLGMVAQRRNEVEVARSAYGRALELDPQHALAIHNLAVLDGMHRTVSASQRFGTVLRLDPQNELARENLDAVMVNFALILFLLGGAGVVVALAVVRASGGSGPAPALTAAGFTLFLAAYVGWVGSQVPRGVRRFALSRWRHNGLAVWNTILAAVETAVVYVVSFAPNGEEIGMVALRPVLLTLVVLGVRTLVARSRR